MKIYNLILSFLAGIIGSMGLGGGSILIIYLSAILLMEQTKAQGINVLFFIPCAIYAVIYYAKENLIIKEVLIPVIISGVFGTMIGSKFLTIINTDKLSAFFGIFLIALSTKELIGVIKNIGQR